MSKVLVDRELLERVCLRHGRESQAVNHQDIIDRGRAQAEIRELLARPAEAEGVEPVEFWVLFDATTPEKYIKKMMPEGFLAFFDHEEDAIRAKTFHPGTDYKRVPYVRQSDHLAALASVTAERDRLCAEVEALRGLVPDFPPRPPDGEGLPRYGLRLNGPQQPLSVPMADGYWTPWHLAHAEVEALRKDKERLDAIEQECWDVRFLSSPNADAGDSSISIEIVGHFMAEPCERVVGESYSENLRAALDQAMTAEAYPPARPEYDEHGRPARAAMAAKEG